MKLLSDRYLTMQRLVHQSQKGYGTGHPELVSAARLLIDNYGCQSIIDYGAGKGRLARKVCDTAIIEYDPAIPGKDVLPGLPADAVLCFDVIEHIEPDYLENVLRVIDALALYYVYFVIGTAPARKVLPDGRNAHILLKDPDWWREKLTGYFNPLVERHDDKEYTFVGSNYAQDTERFYRF